MRTNITNITNEEAPLTIALVGRVNVGKSTLFNTLIENQKAIVSNVPGTTRTSNVGNVVWRGEILRVVDTGGLTFDDGVDFEEEILVQSERAMKEADIILFVTDAKTGILPQEKELAKRLRRVIVKPVVLVANKVDTRKIAQNLTEPDWYKLGMGQPFPISAANGRNVGDLLDHIFTLIDTQELKNKKQTVLAKEVVEEDPMDLPIQISLIGKPNVGKSSLFNRLIGEERVIVSDQAHTTREPFDTMLSYSYTVGEEEKQQKMNFIDTAGIRRKAKVGGRLEREGIHKSITSLDNSDIILLVVDGSEPISQQDMQLGGLTERHSKSVIILVNKWDLAEDTSDEHRNFVKKFVYSHFPHLKFAEILFVSGKTGHGVHKIFPLLMKVWRARHTYIANRALENFLDEVTKKHRPARGKGTRHPKLLGFRQLHTAPPIFELFVKYRTSVHRSYVHYLENRLRERYDFTGTPIVIKLTKTKR